MEAYKLFRIDSKGGIRSLFINKGEVLPQGVWLKAESYPTNGFAYRMGWHCCRWMNAPHLALNPASGMRRAWYRVEVLDYASHKKPESQGGEWLLAQQIRIIAPASSKPH